MTNGNAATQAQALPEGVTFEGGDFAALLKSEFRPKTEQARTAVEQAVMTLAEQALSNTALISDDAIKSIQAIDEPARLADTIVAHFEVDLVGGDVAADGECPRLGVAQGQRRFPRQRPPDVHHVVGLAHCVGDGP